MICDGCSQNTGEAYLCCYDREIPVCRPCYYRHHPDKPNPDRPSSWGQMQSQARGWIWKVRT